MSYEESAKTILSQIRAKKEERNKRREMLTDALMADPEYKTVSDEIEVKQSHRKDVKSRLMKNPNIYQLNEALKTVNAEVKSLQRSLFDNLFRMEVETGEQLSLFDDNGKMLKVVKTYRIG